MAHGVQCTWRPSFIILRLIVWMEIILFTNKQTLLKTSTSLCYATPVGKIKNKKTSGYATWFMTGGVVREPQNP